MKKKNRIPLLLTLLLIALVGLCLNAIYGPQIRELRPLKISQTTPNVDSPNEFTLTLNELTPVNIGEMVEIRVLSSPVKSWSVVRIAEDPRREHILAIYGDGRLLKWDMLSASVEAEHDFLTASPENTFFNGNGSLLITTGEIVWDTETGDVLSCRSYAPGEKCPTSSSISEYSSGMYVDPVRPVKITFPFYGVSWSSLSWGAFTDSMGLNNGHLACWDFIRDYDPYEGGVRYGKASPIERITIDPGGTYVACSLYSGVIIVRDWSLAFSEYEDENRVIRNTEYPYKRFLRFNLPHGSQTTRDITFDPSRTWLAALTDRNLVLWDLRVLFFTQRMNLPVNDGNVIGFDRSGQLLALGTDRGICIYDVEKSERIADIGSGKVTALFFTPDNRLLVWGDAQGYLHLWGVPKEH